MHIEPNFGALRHEGAVLFFSQRKLPSHLLHYAHAFP